MTGWQGSFHFGDYWAAYRGAAGDHHAGHALMVRPRVSHQLTGHAAVTLLLIEPQTPLCRALVERMGTADVAELPVDLVEKVDFERPLSTCLGELASSVPPQREVLDPRLQEAIDYLEAEGGVLASERR